MMQKTRVQTRILDAAMRVFAESGSSVVNISELAQTAGMARGTVYNNISEPERLFEDVARTLSHEMFHRSAATMINIPDPARRLAHGVRMFLRRAHEDHHWGRFLIRFAMTNTSLKQLLHEPPADDIHHAIAAGRYELAPEQLPAFVSLVAGAALSGMLSVVDGERGWCDAGIDLSELLLRAAGIDPDEARAIAREPLPDLADIGR